MNDIDILKKLVQISDSDLETIMSYIGYKKTLDNNSDDLINLKQSLMQPEEINKLRAKYKNERLADLYSIACGDRPFSSLQYGVLYISKKIQATLRYFGGVLK